MCLTNLVEKSFTRKMPLVEFERILDEIVPKHGTPQINLKEVVSLQWQKIYLNI